MIPGYHDQEKFAQTHRQNLLNEAEHERRLAQLPQSDRSSPVSLSCKASTIPAVSSHKAAGASKAPQAGN